MALMDFAAAAELAELEDRQQQAHGGEGTTATLLQNGRAESEDTRSTITFPGALPSSCTYVGMALIALFSVFELVSIR